MGALSLSCLRTAHARARPRGEEQVGALRLSSPRPASPSAAAMRRWRRRAATGRRPWRPARNRRRVCWYGLADVGRHVIGCHSAQETRVHEACADEVAGGGQSAWHVLDDVASIVRPALLVSVLVLVVAVTLVPPRLLGQRGQRPTPHSRACEDERACETVRRNPAEARHRSAESGAVVVEARGTTGRSKAITKNKSKTDIL